MGISGLLPLLKSIQVNRHISELAGETLGIDAYVWLHRGVYACATEIAMGKMTTKYVDYAMHRVRLLRHHRVKPYVVFDGGPLPAKKQTESSRKKRREENLAKGHALVAQGRHNEARDCFVKCVDVTPQMAFQFIKVLRAEQIPFIVAPYEADAQLAYLERTGVIDGIVTEDSDLLVFGCRNVHFKLDSSSSTLTSISRASFASLDTFSSGVSLLGWSDSEFRAMAILSGCDYLPSIPGVGLKTAWSLLRKHKTAEKVVRAIQLEGKKTVPQDYLKCFKLAECCFLHQRVYDPSTQRLVNLTDRQAGFIWTSEVEAYIGSDIEPALAKRIAEGDVDPCTLLPINDVNPKHTPRTVKALPLSRQDLNQFGNMKGKARETPNEGILRFFSRKPKSGVNYKSFSQPTESVTKPGAIAGRSSGKRTLADVMDHEMAARKKNRSVSTPCANLQSRFFTQPESDWTSKHSPGDQDLPIYISDDDEAEYSRGASLEVSIRLDEKSDCVSQEEGYLSPSGSPSDWDVAELSSPIRGSSHDSFRRSRGFSKVELQGHEGVFDADVLSSPPLIGMTKHRSVSPICLDNVKEREIDRMSIQQIGVCDSLLPNSRSTEASSAQKFVIPSRWEPASQNNLFDGEFGELRDFDGEVEQPGSPVASTQSGVLRRPRAEDLEPIWTESSQERGIEILRGSEDRPRQASANDWWDRWAFVEQPRSSLKRRETTVGFSTLEPRSGTYAQSRPVSRKVLPGTSHKDASRKCLAFTSEKVGKDDWSTRLR